MRNLAASSSPHRSRPAPAGPGRGPSPRRDPAATPASFAFAAIGTGWQIDTPSALDAASRAAILDLVARFDATWSRFRDDTPIAAIAAATRGGEFVFPAADAPLFDLFDRLHEATDGAVDPLVGADLVRLGYDPACSLRPAAAAPPARPGWRRDVERRGATLRTERPLVIDVGAAGKGLLVDRVATLLHERGVTAFTVDGSGDMRHAGGAPLRVGLQHPFLPDRVVGVALIANEALCASAVTRRAWGEGLHHVIDGRTGMPTAEVVATWAIAPEAMIADGLATALFFPGGEVAAAALGATWVRHYRDGRIEASATFQGELHG